MTHAWCRDPARDEAVRAAEDNRQGPLPTLEECVADARAMMPKFVSGSSAVEQENKGDGMRTERVTLEITWIPPSGQERIKSWLPSAVLERWFGAPGESVRVVEECCLDRINMGEVIRERDAAIRERDEFRRTLVAEHDHALRIKAERDAAIREREELRTECERRLTMCEEMKRDRDSQQFLVSCLRARVAELEAERDAAMAEEKRLKDVVRQLSVKQFVRQQEAAPAASGAANSPGEPKSAEPVAYWVQWKTDTVIDKWTFQSTFPTLKVAAEYIDEYAEEDDQPEIVPLYTAPPPARGWLTEEEREALTWLMNMGEQHDDVDVEYIASQRARALLARSKPPEVVLPTVFQRSILGDPLVALEQVKAALAAAGVTCKEVGK